MRYCALADKEEMDKVVFTVIYQEKSLKYLFIKRSLINQLILKKSYQILPKGPFQLYALSTHEDARITIQYKAGRGYKNLEDRTYFSRFLVKGVRAKGVRLTTKAAQTIRIKRENDPKAADDLSLFKDIDPFDDDE